MKHRKKTDRIPALKWRITKHMCIFCTALIILLYLFQVVFLEDFYKGVKRSEIKMSAATLLRNINNDDIESLMNRISQENDICISLHTKSGKKLAESHIIRDCILHNMPQDVLRTLYDKAASEGGKTIQTFPRRGFNNGGYNPSKFEGELPEPDKGLGESILLVALKHSDFYGEDIVLFMNTTTSPVSATVNTLQKQLLVIVAILLIFALFMSYIMSKQIAAPISRMSDEAKKLATGDYGVNFIGRGYKESAELARSLNYAADELSKNDRLQRELIANISHDLRTPLTMISGCAEMMQDIPGEMNKENLQVIIDESKRLSMLVNDVMDLSKLGANVEQLNKTDFSLTKSIEETIERISRMCAEKGYKISFECDCDAIVCADKTRMLQVIYNLLINAINHTGEDKRVIVRQIVSEAKNSVRVEITDTGEGIAHEDLPYIWDRYYKVDKIHRRANIGSGLGLSIVQNILKLHKACYGVTSNIGEGSTFWFELT